MHEINVICVNQGNYCGLGAEYVHKLYDMVRRNTSKDFRFIVFTDDPEPYGEGIEKRSIPEGLKGWFAKLFLFSKEAGLEGQSFFFDLDTVITSSLNEVFEYRGEFCILRDFYRPEGFGSGLMSWREGFGVDIWERFKAEGFPNIEGGDQVFIEKCVPKADIFQDLFKGIYSYKQNDCDRWPPEDTKIICFHGFPKPHDVKGSWLDFIWKIGGARNIEENRDCMNTSLDKVIENMTENCKKDIPWFIPYPAKTKSKTLCIVGGAPSLKDNLGELKSKIRLGAHVMSVNGSLKYLRSIGIKPDFHCQFDARPDNADFLDNAPDGVTYLIGSMSHPSVFDKVAGKKVLMWHGGFDFAAQEKILEPYQYKPIVIIGGGTTVSLRALYIGYLMGYYKYCGFGMDSSFSGREHHAYPQPLNDRDGYINVHFNGKTYQCAPWMYRQALNFQDAYKQMVSQGCSIDIKGTGLLPDMCALLNSRKDVL